ncbi:C4-dicarboxylate transporter/malic acid transport protein [Thiorhodococcus drewsii AZ1]|uniref:C4-dicarboxylate transporter/malic acid transport protein n=1 Tax=Thiorhodococcus drewsii AZ1 TaxID=765913 RepID=G2E2G4_9GAMM|nr:C4-dicarboxylate transporter/malic acid transport protein [Thiorhodococcus drewsii]EGV30880.1 C4-dicarboxylate transporter/malic acid transport protein [Thiorhodococcus drewsii AZ1]
MREKSHGNRTEICQIQLASTQRLAGRHIVVSDHQFDRPTQSALQTDDLLRWPGLDSGLHPIGKGLWLLDILLFVLFSTLYATRWTLFGQEARRIFSHSLIGTIPVGLAAARGRSGGAVLDLAFFSSLGTVLVAALALMWSVVAARTLHGGWQGSLFVSPCIAAAN